MDVKDVSGVGDFVSFLQRLKRNAELASRRKGEIPRDHPPAGLLVTQFMITRSTPRPQPSGEGNAYSTSQVPPAYLPCVLPIERLQPLPISKMRQEEHHRGKRVTIRTMTPPDRINAIMAIAEDEEGTAVLLQIYNQPEEAVVKADYLLPQNTVCIVKEPFFKVTTDGKYSLRVDHIADIVFLSENDERVPRKWRSQRKIAASSEDTRLQGNAAVSRQDWGHAEKLYTDAIVSATTDEQEKSALLNRSLANLRLDRPEKALADALRARKGDAPGEKGLFREAKAHYALGQFSLCSEKLRQALDLNASNKDAQAELQRVNRRILEEEAGEYSWKQMHAQARATPPFIDCATFASPVEVRPSPGRGNGLFTTKAVKAGDLLLCEKAFAYSYAAEDDPLGRQNIKVLMNLGSNRISLGGQAILISAVVQKLHHNPRTASRFTELHRGDYPSAHVAELEEPVVDTFLVDRIISLNCFGAPRTSLKRVITPDKQTSVTEETTCGVWTIASHINHSCVGNCRRSFIGDMMVVRACRDVAAGTELMFSYSLPENGEDYQATQKRLENWGFSCQCELCKDKKIMSKQTFQKRRGLLKDLQQVMRTCKTQAQEIKAQRLLEKLETCYPERESAIRLELWDSYLALAQKRLERGKTAEALELTIKSFESLGYIISAAPPGKALAKPKLEIKKWGFVNDRVIVAFIGMFYSYKSLAPELCELAKGYARIAYCISFGETETAGTVYQELQ